MILSFINIARSLGKLKASGFALVFQHFPRDLANVNEWKIMFDPSIVIYLISIYTRKLMCKIADRSRWHHVHFIRITCPCNEYPFTPHFYVVKLGFRGVYVSFLFLL